MRHCLLSLVEVSSLQYSACLPIDILIEELSRASPLLLQLKVVESSTAIAPKVPSINVTTVLVLLAHLSTVVVFLGDSVLSHMVM